MTLIDKFRNVVGDKTADNAIRASDEAQTALTALGNVAKAVDAPAEAMPADVASTATTDDDPKNPTVTESILREAVDAIMTAIDAQAARIDSLIARLDAIDSANAASAKSSSESATAQIEAAKNAAKEVIESWRKTNIPAGDAVRVFDKQTNSDDATAKAKRLNVFA